MLPVIGLGVFDMATINGTLGHDALTGTAAGDLMHGLGGDDTVNGGGGSDTLYGGDGADLVGGGSGNDYASGGIGNDTVIGGSGQDTLFGDDGFDTLDGGSGNDYLDGGAGHDRLVGGDGSDQMFGGDGNDRLYGGDGRNIFNGGTGNDTMYSWLDDSPDTLTGGADSDVFFFSTNDPDNTPADWGTITDFDSTGADGDKIDLSDEYHLGVLTFLGSGAFTASGVAEFRFSANGVGGPRLNFDLDGDGVRDGTIYLPGVTSLGADDFIL